MLLQILLNQACLLEELDGLIIDSNSSNSENLISLSYSMPPFSVNLFGLFLIPNIKMNTFFHHKNDGGKMSGTKNEATEPLLKFNPSILNTLY